MPPLLPERVRSQVYKRLHPWLRIDRRPWHGPFALLYHHLAEHEGPYLDNQSVTGSPRDFEEQIAFLAANYELVRFSELPSRRGDSRAVAITFDDGFRSVASTALPIAERYDCPIKVFLTSCNVEGELNWMCQLSALLHVLEAPEVEELATRALRLPASAEVQTGNRFLERFDPERTPQAVAELFKSRCSPPEERLYLDEAEVRALAAHPLVELGSHSRNHYPLCALPEKAVRDEVVTAHLELQAAFGPAIVDHAVPFGRLADLTETVAAAHREIGSPLISNYGGRYDGRPRFGVEEIRRRSMRGNAGVLYQRLSSVPPAPR